MKKKQTITYKKAGVDIDEGDRFVDLIGPMVKKTYLRSARQGGHKEIQKAGAGERY
jgi:phosphoribosylaminoimidazole (AIR) synthetase